MRLILQHQNAPVVNALFTTPEEVTNWMRRALSPSGVSVLHIDYTYDPASSIYQMAVFTEDETKKKKALEGFYLSQFSEYYGENVKPSFDFKSLI